MDNKHCVHDEHDAFFTLCVCIQYLGTGSVDMDTSAYIAAISACQKSKEWIAATI